MKKSRYYWFLVLPLIYLGVFFGFGFLQFSDLESQSLRLGPFVFEANRGSMETDQTLASLTVQLQEGRFLFSPENPVVLTSGPFEQQVALRGYRFQDNQVIVEFQRGFELVFHGSGDQWYIEPRAGASDVTKAALPFLQGYEGLERYRGLPVLTLGRGEGAYFLSVPSNGLYNRTRKQLVIPIRENRATQISVQKNNRDTDPYSFWLHGNQEDSTLENFSTTKEAYWDKAFLGWKQGRWINNQLQWILPGNNRGFSPHVVRSFLSESQQRGEFLVNFDRLNSRWNFYPRDWDYRLAPYYGNLITTIPAYRQRLVTRFFERPDQFPAAFQEWSLAMDVLLWPVYIPGAAEIKEDWRRRLGGEMDPEWTGAQQIGFLLGQWMSRELRGDDRGSQYWDEALQKAVFPRVASTEEGLLLENENGFLDLRLSFMAAGLLKRVAGISDTLPYGDLAHMLESTAYGLSDGEGLFPSVLVPSQDQLIRDGGLGPEEVYPLVMDNPVYPQLTLVDQRRFPGAYLYSGTNVVSVETTGSQMSLEFQHPVGRSHFFILGNLPIVDTVVLHDLEWRSDSNFQDYSDGYFYSPVTNTLYMKLTHRQRNDKILITF